MYVCAGFQRIRRFRVSPGLSELAAFSPMEPELEEPNVPSAVELINQTTTTKTTTATNPPLNQNQNPNPDPKSNCVIVVGVTKKATN